MSRLLAYSALLAVLLAAPAVAASRREYRFSLNPKQFWMLWRRDIPCRKGHPVRVITTGCEPKHQLAIFDRNHRFIATDLSQKNRQVVDWTPAYTGKYIVCLTLYVAPKKRPARR